jgi:predicted nucleic acid-binding protein
VSYLLDVNALLAWEHRGSPHHTPFHAWADRKSRTRLWTCAHSELGFIRVSLQVFGYKLAQAMEALGEMKRHTGGFVESAPSPRLPAWAATPARTADGYLAQLAQANDLKLATFDAGIHSPVTELIA